MRGFFITIALGALLPFAAAAANPSPAVEPESSEDDQIVERLDSVVVSASRAGKNTPMTYTNVSREQLRNTSPLNSLPMSLNLQPSVVAMNEGGTGIGYSKMYVRGSMGSQINVTLNGITLNDAESQEVFWVNIPALTNILGSVQLQRGLGTSANGAGAFGASINMNTTLVHDRPYANVDLGYGSYNTFTATAAAGTGLTKSGVYFDFAYSRDYTDGYIRNAYARVQSVFATLGWMRGSNNIKLTYLFGNQHSGITWNGIEYADYERDRRYNSAGEYTDQFGNTKYYDNETDNYWQHHLQLNYTHQFARNVVWTTTLNYTKGYGYYEQYKTGKKLSNYNLPSLDPVYTVDPASGEVSTTSKGDLITRKWMDNDLWVLNSEVCYTGEKVSVTGGVNLSRYDGGHFGKVKWSSLLGDNYDYDSFNAAHTWYDNTGLKTELNVFARAEYTPLDWLTAYVDLQYRGISLKMYGTDSDDIWTPFDYRVRWNFFNPRAGLTFNVNRHKAYVSAALGNREPGRDDIQEMIYYNESGLDASLKPEKMVDVEIGYVYTAPKVTASANIYLMEYFDMLLDTGKINESGYAIKENTSRAYRRGIELAAAWGPAPWFRLDANLTLSLNKALDYSYSMPVYDDDYYLVDRIVTNYGTTNLLLSPSVIGMARLSFTPFRTVSHNSLRTTTLSLTGKYVGKQYLDNTSSDDRMIPGYFVAYLALTHEFDLKAGKLGIGGYINNLFNNMYYSDGWVSMEAYRGDEANPVTYTGIFPQAPINFMLKLSYSF